MVWNHRVVRRSKTNVNGTIEHFYGIHGAYYDAPDSPAHSITCSPVEVVSDSIEGLRWTLERMLECLDKLVLVEEGDRLVQVDR